MRCKDRDRLAGGPARLAGGTVPVAGGPAAGDGRAAGESATPLTDRGSLCPIGGRVDAVSDTVWAPFERVLDVVESALIAKWMPDDGRDWVVTQHDSKILRRAAGAGGSVVVVERKGEGGEWAGHCGVQLKGVACEVVGTEGVHDLLAALSSVQSVHSPVRRSSRVDWAWDGVPFTPYDVKAAVECGNVVSAGHIVRAGTMPGNATARFYLDEGATCYCGVRTGAYMTRCYDRRGPVRFELELKESAAIAAGDVLAGDGWASCARWFLGVARYVADFVDRSAGERGCRAELLPWWAAFVTDAERIRPVSGCDRRGLHIAAELERAILRTRRCVARFARLGLCEWYLDRCISSYTGQWGPGDDEWVRRVLALKGRGFCGLPHDYGEHVPF